MGNDAVLLKWYRLFEEMFDENVNSEAFIDLGFVYCKYDRLISGACSKWDVPEDFGDPSLKSKGATFEELAEYEMLKISKKLLRNGSDPFLVSEMIKVFFNALCNSHVSNANKHAEVMDSRADSHDAGHGWSEHKIPIVLQNDTKCPFVGDVLMFGKKRGVYGPCSSDDDTLMSTYCLAKAFVDYDSSFVYMRNTDKNNTDAKEIKGASVAQVLRALNEQYRCQNSDSDFWWSDDYLSVAQPTQITDECTSIHSVSHHIDGDTTPISHETQPVCTIKRPGGKKRQRLQTPMEPSKPAIEHITTRSGRRASKLVKQGRCP